MQDWQNAGKKGCRKGGIQEKSRKIGKQERVEIWTRGIQERGNLGKEGCMKEGFRTVGIQERKEAELEGYRTAGMQDWNDAGKEECGTGGILDSWDARLE